MFNTLPAQEPIAVLPLLALAAFSLHTHDTAQEREKQGSCLSCSRFCRGAGAQPHHGRGMLVVVGLWAGRGELFVNGLMCVCLGLLLDARAGEGGGQ